jgi:hypothetical protein
MVGSNAQLVIPKCHVEAPVQSRTRKQALTRCREEYLQLLALMGHVSARFALHWPSSLTPSTLHGHGN